ncbi:uncharacterized protein ARMOST_20736 [Armillaria ostoyae]|uniref:F-box domain-containing protein n=1 Tax=Armillaria ostoyae TaxID=47428 RepID=A0A284S840_ARMOS|nr:uncharacterized protein ARMOST_20736 [Armillaria ostoyae]
MANSNISQYTQFPIQKLPPELLAEILSYLTVTEIKPLSLTCTILNNDCFPFVFRNLLLHRNHHRATKFIVDFKDRTPAVPCLRKLILNELSEDISKEILPWSTLVRSAKIDGGHLGNLTILPSLKLLQVLELVNIAVQSRSDYFEILSTIPLSVKDLRLRNNTFLDNLPLPRLVTPPLRRWDLVFLGTMPSMSRNQYSGYRTCNQRVHVPEMKGRKQESP